MRMHLEARLDHFSYCDGIVLRDGLVITGHNLLIERLHVLRSKGSLQS